MDGRHQIGDPKKIVQKSIDLRRARPRNQVGAFENFLRLERQCHGDVDAEEPLPNLPEKRLRGPAA